MTLRVGPEQAQELLTGSEPGPWEVIAEYTDGEPRPYDSHRIRTESGVYVGIMHGQDAPLTAAAPDLAETIAGMRWEYAVQVSNDGGESWRFAHGAAKATFDPIDPCWWFRTEEEARDFAKFRAPKRGHARVVRRLVSDVEVVE